MQEVPDEFPPTERVVREPECERRTGLSRTTRWRMERTGQFPERISISPGCVGWAESEIIEWLHVRMKARRRRSTSSS